MNIQGGLAVTLAVLVVVASLGVATAPAAAEVQRPNDVFTEAVTAQTGWFGGWAPSDDVPLTAEGHPYWVVKFENGSAGDLEAWAEASSERTVRSTDPDARMMVISAPPKAVGIGTWAPTWSTPLRDQQYVEEIGLNRRLSVDPIKNAELRRQSAWSSPEGTWLATYGGVKGSLEADGAAWGEEVNTSTLQEARQAVAADTVAENGSGVRVAVLDTGLNYNQELYGDRVVAGKNVLTNETLNTSKSPQNRSYDKLADGSDSRHGSWVATAIGGNGAGPNATGVAPGAELVPVKVLGDDGSGTTEQIAQGLKFACEDANADVVSMSLGSPLASMQLEHEIRSCLEEDGVSAVVVAGGNNRMTTRYLQSPGDSMQVITVGATDARSINASESAYFSAVGPDPATKQDPDVAAPGLKVTAEVDSGNRTLSGTSMATPIQSGVLALTLEANPALKGEPAEVRSYVQDHAEPMPQAGETEVGAGRTNAEYAVQDTVPEESQETVRTSDAENRDRANGALSGSVWRGVGLPSLVIEAPAAAEVAG